MYGYRGKLLSVDLTERTIKDYSINDDLYRNFLGGRGLGSKLLYDLLPANVDPLAPENVLLILTGPVTGTLVPVSGKYVVITKSPVTGGFVDSYSSGRIAAEIKFAGYDGLIIRGKSEKPVYICLIDDEVKIKAANHIWGKDTFQTEDYIRNEYKNEEIGIMCIGPAGENGVKYATISSDYYRHAARGGVGTVMGSKNLKAIVARGRYGIKAYDIVGVIDLVKEHFKKVADSKVAQNRMRYGTPLTWSITNTANMLPTKNFQKGYFHEGRGNLNPEALDKDVYKGSRGCYGCYFACSKISKVDRGTFANLIIEGPEYETLGLFGSNLGINNLPAILKANEICDRLGLDTISTGNTIGFAMECFEKGLLNPKDIGGENLIFGDFQGVFKLIEDIAYQRGLGAILSEGVRKAAKQIGKNSYKFAMEVKGLEFPAYEPRVGYGPALVYAVSPRGACHRRAWPPTVDYLGKENPYETDGKAEIVKKLSDENNIYHSLIICDFPAKWLPLSLEDFAKYLNLLLGWEINEQELWVTADRIETQIRLFNVREGLERKDDTLPWRTTNEYLITEHSEERRIPLEKLELMLDNYYHLRGWDSNGVPTKETLNRLNLLCRNKLRGA